MGCPVGNLTIVNGENFPDGLVASVYGDRILLTKAAALPAETVAELKRLDTACTTIGAVRIVGGTAAVSQAVYEALDTTKGVTSVERISGADRYGTALAVAADIDSSCDDAILATGANFPDALAAGPFAKTFGAEIVLNDGSSLRSAVKDHLASCTGTITIIGGTAAVPESIEDELEDMGKDVERISGDNRAETAAAIAGELIKEWGVFYLIAGGNVALVNGNGFADALAAGPLAIAALAPMLVVNANSIPLVTAGTHVALCGLVSTVWAIGGTAVISDAVLEGAADATACVEPEITSATVANSKFEQAKCELTNTAGGGDGVMVTAVPGGPADGAAGNLWDITVKDSDGANYVVADVSNPAAPTLEVGIEIVDPDPAVPGDVGTTQQMLVDAWFALGGDATKYFTPAVTATTGAPDPYTDTKGDPGGCTANNANGGKQTQVVTVTFNQKVDDDPATTAGTVLVAGDFTGLVGFAVTSPLVATPGGASVYVLAQATTDATALVAAGDAVGVAAASAYSTANGVVVDDTVPTLLTAG
jgi:putative cell wall-binding protein